MIKFGSVEYFRLIYLRDKLGIEDYNKLDLLYLDKLKMEIEIKIKQIELDVKVKNK